MSRRSESQGLAYLIRRNPTLLDRLKDEGSFDEAPVLLVEASVLKDAVYVAGRNLHAVQLDGVGGGDSWKVQGSLDGVTFYDITGLTALTANGITQFSGVYRVLKALKNGGGGTTSMLTLLSMAG